jgi:fengycin family lipopeptide synthetase D
MINKSEIKNIYSLSPMQEGMLFHSLVDSESKAYFEQRILTIRGNIDIELFETSFNMLIDRYDILRSVFFHENLSKPQQLVFKSRKVKINFEDVSNQTESEKYIESFIENDKKNSFDLKRDILIRLSILKIRKEEYKIIWSFHHILMDGWCIGILMSDFFDIYYSLKDDKKIDMEPVVPYINYINWLKSKSVEKGLEYWKSYLDGYESLVMVPETKENTSDDSNTRELNSIRIKFDKNQTKIIETVAKKNQITVNILFQAAWGILLQKYNNTDDVVFGSVVSGRHAEVEGIENMVGLFINTLPVRVKAKKDTGFIELAKNMTNDFITSSLYDYVPLYELHTVTKHQGGLINNIMIYENYPTKFKTSGYNDLEIEDFYISEIESKEETNYDFNTVIIPGQELIVEFQYNTNKYCKNFIMQIGEHLTNIIKIVTSNVDILIKDINILGESERYKILHEFNNTQVEYPEDKTIQELFQNQVGDTPDNLAVVFEDKHLTYKQLNIKANQLARILRNKGIKPNQRVGIFFERSIEMIIAIMGTLKAGGAYLPIDTEYPSERIKYLLEDSNSKLVLTDSNLAQKIDFDGDIINLEDKLLFNGDCADLLIINSSRDISHIIYTSGTTGKPKGVMLEHRSVVNVSHWFNNRYCISKNRNVIQMTSISFDVSVEEILTTLMYGGTVYIPTKEVILDKSRFAKYINENKINIAQFVPTTLKELLGDSDKLESLNVIISGAEKLEDSLKNQIISKGYSLYNHYGPTETTTDAVVYKCEAGRVVIGKPIDNAQIYIISDNNELQPIGVPGELCISGDVLAKGYLNRPELTESKFVPNPFVKGQKMYKTGDWAKWLPNGNVEYISRIDHQVKVRGIRVELGEIESELLKHEAVKEAVIVDQADENGNRYLAAYVVSDKKLKAQELRHYLMSNLPRYMIPSYFVQLDQIPLMQNGKIDRKKLSHISEIMETDAEYVAPKNEIEQKLVDIWESVLKVNSIGVNDDFFELGGHSLKATVLVSKIHKELDIQIPLKEIFTHTTIKELAGIIHQMKKSKYVKIEPIPESDYYPASSAQKRIYLLSQLEEESTNYNMTDMMIISGRIDLKAFENIFNLLIKRHEALRTYFTLVNGELIQKVHEDVDFRIDYSELNENLLMDAIKKFSTHFDFGKAPLLRVKLVKISEERHLLFVDMNHIISDGASIDILIREFAELYEGRELKPLKIQYKDYASWQNEIFRTNAIKQEEEYWFKIFEHEVPMLDISTDYPRPTIQSFEGNTIEFKSDMQLKKNLNLLGMKTNTTMYMILLSAYYVLLSKYSGQEDIVVGTPVAGRTHPDVQNIVGIFVNTLALRNYPSGEKTFKQFLNEVKENSIEAFENQNYQFEKLIEKLDIKRQMDRNPLFDVMFAFEEIEDKFEVGSLKFEPYKFERKISKFDLSLAASQKSEDMEFSIEYCTKLFKLETINMMAVHYINILKQIVENPNIKLSEINMLNQKEKEQILYEFNNKSFPCSYEKTIYQLFEDQVEKAPDSLAVVFDNKQLTYKELNEKSNQLAHTLRRKGVKSDNIIGLMVESSMEMIVGIIGILKAGGAYLPIDPQYPEERISYMLEDCNVNILLTQNHIEVTTKFAGEIIRLDDTKIYYEDNKNPESPNKLSDLAYVIYTSGSTGQPKGVMVEHRNLVAYVNAINKEVNIKEEDVMLQQTTYCFDGFIDEIFPVITTGGTIIIVNRNHVLNIDELYQIIEYRRVNLISGTPMLLNEINKLPRLDSVHAYLCGGDVLKYEYINNIIKSAKVYNQYGPTETTVCATCYDCSKENEQKIPIGKPIANYKVYILNKDNKLQPIGIPGELCIGGYGVTRGYLNKPELTAEKFISDPYSVGERMYKTGDLAKWLHDGNIEFLGRIDQQVKIRGFRIELQEIEMKLFEYQSIKSAVVLDKKGADGNEYLCAYVVADKEITAIELRNYLLKTLPEYMIPAQFIQLEKMPLSSSGKINRRELLKIKMNISTGTEYKSPMSIVEKRLARLWAEILDLDSEEISITDSFFNLGGNSISLLKLTSQINNQFDTDMKITDFFNLTTIEQIAAVIDGNEQNEEDKDMIKFSF